MRARVMVCSNGQLVLRAEHGNDVHRFSLDDVVEVRRVEEDPDARFLDQPLPAEDWEPDEE